MLNKPSNISITSMNCIIAIFNQKIIDISANLIQILTNSVTE